MTKELNLDSFEEHGKSCFGSLDWVRALHFIWSWLGFLLAAVRISVRIAAHWLQTYCSWSIQPPNLTLHSQFIVKSVSENSHLP